MMPLNFADPGKDYTIQRVGGTPAVKKHLEELGFVADGTVQVINTIIGSDVVVKKLHGEGAVKRRIMDMGITKGAEVHVRKVAPLGDPVEVTVRGYELSLRKEDAEKIEVE